MLDQPRTEDQLLLVQPQTGDPDRHITRVTLTFDGGHPVSVPLSPASRTAAGEVVTFPARTFTTLRITITGVTVDDPSSPVGSRSSTGFAEVGHPRGDGRRDGVDAPGPAAGHRCRRRSTTA